VVEDTTQRLKAVPGVVAVSQVPGANGSTQLRCEAAGGSQILEPIGAVLRESGVSFTELYQQRGDLDSVFRQITGGGDHHA